LETEKSKDGAASLLGESVERVRYHLELIRNELVVLVGNGWNDYEIEKSDDGIDVVVSHMSLNWSGHEFIDNVRNDDFWNVIKSKIKKLAKDNFMKNISTVILNQVYDETLRNLKGLIKIKEYLPGNEWMGFYRRGINNLKYRNLPKITL